jgi:hypothetical protein
MEDAWIPRNAGEFSPEDIMITSRDFPLFDACFPKLNQFILELVKAYEAGQIKSWDDLEERVSVYFTVDRMEQMESRVPGWQKMASYRDGITLTHLMGVFLGLFMLPEFRSLSDDHQQLAKWIVLFHDLAKEITIGAGEKDKTHAFRSAITTARQLPHLEFAVTSEYEHLISSWSHLTGSAIKISADRPEAIQDNEKLPDILMGIERMFGEGTAAALIVKTVLLHMSINVVIDWPQASPLREAQIVKYVSKDLLPLLKVMMLADNEGWVLFYSEREQQRTETLAAFQRLEKMILG